MDELDIEAIAARVAHKLRDQHVIPASLPAYVGEAIRRATGEGTLQWMHSVPLRGPEMFATYWTLTPDGGLRLDLRDWSGHTFWRGTFRPEASSG